MIPLFSNASPAKKSALLFAVGVVAGLLAAGAGALVWSAMQPQPSAPSDLVSDIPAQDDGTASEPQTASPSTPEVLQIDWGDARRLTVKEIKNLFMSTSADSKDVETYVSDFGFNDDAEQYVGTGSLMWRAGTVHDGNWKGADVYVLRITDGPGFSRFYLLRPAASSTVYAVGMGKPTEEEQYVYDSNPFLRLVSFLPDTGMPDLSIPNILTTTDGVILYQTTRSWMQPYRFELAGDALREMTRTMDGRVVYQRTSDRQTSFPDGSGKTILADNGCFSVFGPDGQEYVYYPHIPLKPRTDGNADSPTGVPDVKWMPGYENDFEYAFRVQGGCGFTGCLSIVTEKEMRAGGDLAVIGKTSTGDDILAPKKPADHPDVQMLYDTWYDPSWGSDYTFNENGVTSSQKPSMDEFLHRYPIPIFFWKDPFGRWVIHRVAAGGPPVECGKPVIYLYPQQTEQVSVRLPSFINVTKSDPAYPASGWTVTAHPDGTVETADGKAYGSLFWEGTGVGYAPPTDGFIIKDGEADARLAEILKRYGLNETESREFRDFWVPKMTGASYYRVSFLTSAWSSAAPLGVSPRPDTVIRIFMDWQKISAPIDIPAPRISTPARTGFTVVEWGGLLR